MIKTPLTGKQLLEENAKLFNVCDRIKTIRFGYYKNENSLEIAIFKFKRALINAQINEFS